ncbi:uncharacterized protein LOC115875674 [Sitophilus oryzae]|uniref:Uncharacterized protein LOC115875674 n=1 Tax=Sitophilus oryzae TaxID=7048 RepID=A0A6J2X7U7_SITOR|nr:uncharacterized protein LOC115875674 [Sitophilus oryzae]
MLQFKSKGGIECVDFIKFAVSQMNNSLCSEAEKKTRAQSENPLWHELRFGRITASKIFEVAHCKTPEGTLVESIIGSYKVRDNKFMKRGRLLEKKVLKCAEQKVKCKFQECGFFTMPLLPVLGASPDGISKDYVVEIKCPSSVKNKNTYIKDNNITAKFKGQLHLQMLCANKKKGLFCVASPDFEESNNVEILEIDFDEQFANELTAAAIENWKKFVFPKVFVSCQ